MGLQTELNLKTIINNTRYNIYLVDINLRFVEFNNSFKEEFDRLYNGNLTIGDNAVGPPIPPEICEDWKRFYAIALTGKKVIQDYQFDGKPYVITLNPVFDNDKIIGIAVFSENMSAEIELRQTLEESRYRQKFSDDVDFNGFWDWNMISNEVYYSNIWKKMLGYEPHEIESTFQAWRNLVHKDDIEGVLALINKHIYEQTELYSAEMRLLCKNGSYKWVMAKGRITERMPDKTPMRFIGFHIDIDQLKKTEADIKKRNEQLREIAYITSHGVRKSLANFVGLASLIEPSEFAKNNKYENIKQLLNAAGELNAETNRLSEVIRNLNIEVFSFSDRPRQIIKNVMVVDDDGISNTITKIFLEKRGYNAILFQNPLEAFEQLKAEHHSIQLILLDINMPGFNGRSFLNKMQSEKITTDVIILTSSIHNSDKEMASGFKNVIDYWTKPLTKDKVMSLQIQS